MMKYADDIRLYSEAKNICIYEVLPLNASGVKIEQEGKRQDTQRMNVVDNRLEKTKQKRFQ